MLLVLSVLIAGGRTAIFWDAANITDYEEESLVYGLQGLVNKAGSQPELFYNTGKKNVDFPASDRTWVDYFEQQKGIRFMPPPKATICDLVSYYKGRLNGSVVYDSDGYSVYIALTIAGLDNVLPISEALMGNHSCLKELRVMVDLRGRFGNKFAAYRWAIDTLLPRTNPQLVFNADYYRNAVVSQGAATIMSVDYPIQNKAFIMDLCPLWKCDPLDCGPVTRSYRRRRRTSDSNCGLEAALQRASKEKQHASVLLSESRQSEEALTRELEDLRRQLPSLERQLELALCTSGAELASRTSGLTV